MDTHFTRPEKLSENPIKRMTDDQVMDRVGFEWRSTQSITRPITRYNKNYLILANTFI